MALYIYVLTTDALSYLLENSQVRGRIHGIILLDASKMENNYFVSDSLLSIRVNQDVAASARDFLSIFFHASGDLVSHHKSKY